MDPPTTLRKRRSDDTTCALGKAEEEEEEEGKGGSPQLGLVEEVADEKASNHFSLPLFFCRSSRRRRGGRPTDSITFIDPRHYSRTRQ